MCIQVFMYWRHILCTLYGAVDFLIVPYKGLYGWGGEYMMLLYVPLGPKKYLFQGQPPSNGPHNGHCPHQNHYVPRHINKRNINSYYEALHVYLWALMTRLPQWSSTSAVASSLYSRLFKRKYFLSSIRVFKFLVILGENFCKFKG